MKNSEILWDESHQLLGRGWSNLSDESRVWVHMSDRTLTEHELEVWSELMEGFFLDWTAHGQELLASWSLLGRRLLVVALDESQADATGCSIDKLMRLIQEEGGQMVPAVDWLTRTHTLYNKDGIWMELDLHEFWAACKAGLIEDDARVVNTVFQKKGECPGKVVLPFSESWHAEMW